MLEFPIAIQGWQDVIGGSLDMRALDHKEVFAG
jgi:hypothetical protein